MSWKSRESPARRSDYEVALGLIESGRVKVDEMVTRRFPLQDTVEALDTASGDEGIKVAVMP